MWRSPEGADVGGGRSERQNGKSSVDFWISQVCCGGCARRGGVREMCEGRLELSYVGRRQAEDRHTPLLIGMLDDRKKK